MDNGRKFVKVYNVVDSSGSNLTVLTEKSSQICRVCLRWGNIPIYGDNKHKNLSNNLESITNIEIYEWDEFPKYLCKSCNILLEGAVLLKENARKAVESLTLISRNNKDNTTCDESPSRHEMDNDYVLKEEHILQDISNIDNANHFGQSEPDEAAELQPSEGEEHEQNTIEDLDQIDNNLKDEPSCALHYTKQLHKKIMKCPLCPQMLRYCDVIKHVNKHPESPDTRCICCFCHKNYKKSNYQYHLRLHILDHEYVCDHCGIQVLGQKRFLDHYNTHKEEFPYTCPHCTYKGKSKVVLKSHMRMHGDPLYICSDCGKQFRSKSNLSLHMSVHQSEPRHYCDICNKGFYFKAKLRQHHVVKHSAAKDYVCDKCGSAFALKKHLRVHERTVHKVEKKPMGANAHYLKHSECDIEVRSEKHLNACDYACSECDKVFTSRKKIEEHIQTYHDLANEITVTTD